MRSRYCAFVKGDADYLLRSWHVSTRPLRLALDDPPPRWLGLEIRRCWAIDDLQAGVEFVACFRHGGGKAVRQHERSRFVLEEGRWFYVDAGG
jgi:SEC-C motif-containing protein